MCALTVTDLTPPPGFAKGCLLRTDKPGDQCPLARDNIELIPRDEWADVIARRKDEGLSMRALVPKILDQNGVGSCAAEEVTQAVMTMRAFSHQEQVILNPWSVYAWTSGGRDGGSQIGDNWARARDVGVMPMDVWPRSKGWRAKPSQSLLDEFASKYRLDEFYDLANTDELVSALLSGFVVGYGRSGHAILGVDMLDYDTGSDTGYFAYANSDTGHFAYANSWRHTWGDEGFGVDKITNVNWRYGAFAARSTISSGGI